MRVLSNFSPRWLCCAAVFFCSAFNGCANPAKNVVAQYHFMGAAKVADDPAAAVAKQIFGLSSTAHFENLVLYRLITNVAQTFHFRQKPETVKALRPLVDEWVRQESVATVIGIPGQSLSYVTAIHLGAANVQNWIKVIKEVATNAPETFQSGPFTGLRWPLNRSDSFWLAPAKDWLLVGRGEASEARNVYLESIQKHGTPSAPLNGLFLDADIDWPRLSTWYPLPACPLKLANTHIALNSENGVFNMKMRVNYSDPILWQANTRQLPTALVQQPLTSFSTGNNVQPFLKSDSIVSRLTESPLRDQYYFWSMGQMPFESYFAWPVKNTNQAMSELRAKVMPVINAEMEKTQNPTLRWNDKTHEISWPNILLALPVVRAVTNAPFMVASLFPIDKSRDPAPAQLWDQFKSRPDLVYYDWEETGPRLLALRSISQVVPLLPAFDIGPKELKRDGSPETKMMMGRLASEEHWLDGISPLLHNTVTEVTKTGPAEVTVARSSPFVFSSFELLLLSHWLSETPAGPINNHLLPMAKQTGTGVRQ